MSHQERIDSLIQLNKVITALPVDGSVIDAALHSGWKDFEDAVQYFTALATTGITGIITRNAKDFRDSQLPVIDPKTFLNSR